MAYVTVESEIPLSDPQRDAIQGAVTRAFSDLPGGPWTIRITRPAMSTGDGPAPWSMCVTGGTTVRAGAIRSSADVLGFMVKAGFISNLKR